MTWILPLLPVLAAALLAWGGGDREEAPSRGVLAGAGAGTMLVTAGLALLAATGGWTGAFAWSETLVLELDYGLRSAPASALFALLVPVVAAPVLVFAAYHEEPRGLRRLLALLVLSVGAMEVIAGAADLLTLLVGWELIGACSALLVTQEWWREGKPRAAAAVFLTTRTGDLGLFLASAAAFAGAGSLAYGDLGSLGGIHLDLVVLGILIAAAAKSAQLPFAPWLFAAMEGPVSVSALLHAATMVASGAFLLVRLHPVLETVAWFGPATLAVGLTTALLAGVVALSQSHSKRLLAGSTSAHYGLMFVAVGAGHPAVAAFHLVAHAFAKAPLFLVSGLLQASTGSYRLVGRGLRRVLPAVAGASALAAGAIAGVPPLGAAWTKEEVVTAAGRAAPWAAILAALAGGLSAAYMARFQLQGFGAGTEGGERRRPRPGERRPLHLLVAVTVALGLLWIPSTHDAAVHALGGEAPSPAAWELVLSLALVAVGVLAGAAIARRVPSLGQSGVLASVARWIALPALARVAVVEPTRAAARLLARLDDRIVDRGVGWAEASVTAVSTGAARLDDRVVDGGVRAVGSFASVMSGGLDRLDSRVVDAGVRASAAFAGWLAGVGRRLGEAVFDGIPEWTSELVGRAGARARRLQTGLVHHYYTLVVAGLGVVIILLLLGG